MEFRKKNIYKEWDFRALSSNPKITIHIILEFPNKHWSLENLLYILSFHRENLLNIFVNIDRQHFMSDYESENTVIYPTL